MASPLLRSSSPLLGFAFQELPPQARMSLPRGRNRGCSILFYLLVALCFVLYVSIHTLDGLQKVGKASRKVSNRLQNSLDHLKPDLAPFWAPARESVPVYRAIYAPGVVPASPVSLGSKDFPLSRFLAERLEHPSIRRPDFLWMTVADGKYAQNVLFHLVRFLGGLNVDERTTDPIKSQPHNLVVLCLDEQCIETCTERGWLCYGGYVKDESPLSGPQNMAAVQWTKTRGMAAILEAGYAVLFVDADVFFRRDPFDTLLMPLSDKSWDIQIQDESHAGMLNIGFIFMRAGPVTAGVWHNIAERISTQGGWDQDHFNAVIDSTRQREKVHTQIFTSPQGLKVRVLFPVDAWGFHFGWLFPEQTTLLHMTCCGSNILDKLYIAASYGALADAPEYEELPNMLTIANLAGTREEVALIMRIVMSAARASGRAFLPPLMGNILGSTDMDDGIVRGDIGAISVDSLGNAPDPEQDPLTLHRRFFWSIFKPSVMKRVWSDVHLLEPNYLEHATQTLIKHNDLRALRHLHTVAVLDLRPVYYFDMLVARLKDPIFADAKVVRLSTDEGPRGFWSRMAKWDLPEDAPRLAPCWHIEKTPACSTFCRKPPDGWIEQLGGTPDPEDLAANPSNGKPDETTTIPQNNDDDDDDD